MPNTLRRRNDPFYRHPVGTIPAVTTEPTTEPTPTTEPPSPLHT